MRLVAHVVGNLQKSVYVSWDMGWTSDKQQQGTNKVC